MYCCYCWLYTTDINTCYVLLLLLTTLQTSTHAMYCCYCWLYTTHINTRYVLLLLVTVHYTHQHMLVYCCYCWLYTTHINTCYVLLLLLAVHYTHQHMLCIVAIVDCTHVHPVVHYHTLLLLLTTTMQGQLQPLWRTCNSAHKNTTADILVEDQLRPTLDMVTQ